MAFLKTSILSFLIFLLSSSAAWALDPIPGEERFSALASEEQTAGAMLGYTTIEGEHFLSITPRLDLNLGLVGLGLQIPLNIRSPIPTDNGDDSKDFGGWIRHDDWDGQWEWLKMIRYVRLGAKRDPFYLRVGELAADLGHGTVMSRYLNNLDANSFRLGVQFDVNTQYGGAETIINDFGGNLDSKSTNSQIIGGRLYIKPMAFVDPESVLNIFAVGLTAVTDRNAPFTKTKDNGDEVSDSKSQTVWGIDVEAVVLNNALLELVPYSDLNFISGAGSGWHLGVMAKAKLPVGLDLQLPIRLEYRNMQGGYTPTYFSTFYDIERFSYPGSDKASQSYYFQEDQADAKGLQGYYGDLAFDFVGLVQIGAFYEDYFGEGYSPNLAVFVSVPALEIVQFKAYYERRGLSGLSDAFVLDEKSYAVAEGRYELFTSIYLVAQAQQRWADDDLDGVYEAADPEYSFGLEASLSF